MRRTRRWALGLGLTGIGALGAFGARRVFAAPRGDDVPTTVAISGTPIPFLSRKEPERQDFGSLRYRSGLVLSSDYSGFGGLSGLWRSPDGRRMLAVSDNAQWLSAEITTRDGRLAGVTNATMSPVIGANGRPLRQGRGYDTESLAVDDGLAYVGIERVNEVLRFDIARDGTAARGIPVPVPAEVKSLANNDGLEAMAVAPAGHPLAGSLVAIAEDLRNGDDGPTRGWVLTGSRRFSFDVVRSEGFDVTDLAFLPTGEALLLERRYRVLSGVACRIRRLPVGAFRPDVPVDGPVVFEAAGGEEIDNMEGIAIHADPATGGTVVTLVSDDNFNALQRTLLLEFALLA